MAKGKGGRRPYKAPDGVETQRPTQTAKANAAPRPMKKRSVYEDVILQQKRKHRLERPGYGRTGHLSA